MSFIYIGAAECVFCGAFVFTDPEEYFFALPQKSIKKDTQLSVYSIWLYGDTLRKALDSFYGKHD